MNPKAEKGTVAERKALNYVYEDEEQDDRDFECGMGSCRPGCLQPFANMKAFTASLSLIYIFGSMNFTYYTAVITQIEKVYGLSSAISGFIKNVDNIGFMSTVLIVSHFLRYSNKPRVFSIATAVSGFSVFIFALPHFIFGSDVYGLSDIDLSNATLPGNATRLNLDLCVLQETVASSDKCVSRSVLAPLNIGAMVFFMISEFIQGIAQSPKFTLSLTHMDDNAKKSSPLYFGIMFGMRSFAPVLGFILGAWTTQLYVDLSDPGFGQKDPRWVGAWWLGFVICGSCTLVLAPPMAFFPPKFKVKGADGKMKKPMGEASGYKKNNAVASNFKDMPKAICRIVKNPIIVCCIISSCFNFYLMGFSTFTPKYLETQFRMTASRASLVTAVVSGTSFCLGPVVSGILVSKMKVTVTGSLKFVVVINMIACLGFVVMGFLGCENQKWAGSLSLNGHNVTSGCNDGCNCDPFVFSPVCGSDNLNYFSPCFAGCTNDLQFEDDTLAFSNCTCVEGGQATEGLCESTCWMVIPYLLVMVVSKFAASMTFVPYISALMRSVEPRDKSLTLGFSSFIMMIASFPAPLVFGWLIDMCCIVQQTSCTRKGACLFYDNDRFRILLHFAAAFIKFAACCGYFCAWLFARKRDFSQPEDQPVKPESIRFNDIPKANGKTQYFDQDNGQQT